MSPWPYRHVTKRAKHCNQLVKTLLHVGDDTIVWQVLQQGYDTMVDDFNEVLCCDNHVCSFRGRY